MSDEYIKREDALKVLCGECENDKVCCASDGEIPACPIFWKMQNIPATNVVEIEPGAWILTDFDGNTMKIKGIQRERIEVENETEREKAAWIIRPTTSRYSSFYQCPICGDGMLHSKTPNFCSNCGADLRGQK